MPKIVVWDDATAQVELKKKLDYGLDDREKLQRIWLDNERTVYYQYGKNTAAGAGGVFDTEEIDNGDSDISVTYAFKNLRFLHAQLSANPPSVIPSPTSNDQDDRRKADAADRLVHHGIRAYTLQEQVDKTSLNTLLYGTGFTKTVWDSTKGDVLEMSEDGQLVLEGDLSISIPSPWRMVVDPDTHNWDDCRYVFEELIIPYEEALWQWPDKKEILDRLRQEGSNDISRGHQADSELAKDYKDVIRLYEYWEKGTPSNGYLGRYCVCTRHGEPLHSVKPNPFRFARSGTIAGIMADDELSEDEKQERISRTPMIAKLPYHIFTDIDVPDQIWGKSFIEYIAELQDMLNRLDSTVLDNVQASGVARLVLPEGAEIADDSITNSPWDFIKMTGTQPPHFMEVPSLMPEMSDMRQYLRQGIDDISGINESMLGKQSRETAGFAMQFATNQGNMIRRRLFNKYVMYVESLYKGYLSLIRKHWDIGRIVQVLGDEKQIESVEIKGADIDGGYDLVVEYGSSLSLDPITRREEILSMQPLFEKAGVPPRVILQMMKLNELSNMRDIIQMSETRQQEIFTIIMGTRKQVQPRKHQDHVNMIASAKIWFMTKEFDVLDEEIKALCEEHIELRAQVEAQERQPQGLEAGPQPPGPPPQGGAGPMGPPNVPESLPGAALAAPGVANA